MQERGKVGQLRYTKYVILFEMCLYLEALAFVYTVVNGKLSAYFLDGFLQLSFQKSDIFLFISAFHYACRFSITQTGVKCRKHVCISLRSCCDG